MLYFCMRYWVFTEYYSGKSVFAIPSLPRHEDVLRFQVSVNDSMAVEEIHSGEDLKDFDGQRKDWYVGKL